MHVKNKLRA